MLPGAGLRLKNAYKLVKVNDLIDRFVDDDGNPFNNYLGMEEVRVASALSFYNQAQFYKRCCHHMHCEIDMPRNCHS